MPQHVRGVPQHRSRCDSYVDCPFRNFAWWLALTTGRGKVHCPVSGFYSDPLPVRVTARNTRRHTGRRSGRFLLDEYKVVGVRHRREIRCRAARFGKLQRLTQANGQRAWGCRVGDSMRARCTASSLEHRHGRRRLPLSIWTQWAGTFERDIVTSKISHFN